MQHAKDSFFIALRDRLAALNPARTVTLGGAARPAVIVAENELTTAARPLAEAFYLRWGAARVAPGWQRAPRPLMALACVVSYRTQGAQSGSVDRGRTLAALDQELLQIAAPPETAKADHTQSPSADLGTRIFWTRPQLAEPETAGDELRRTASLEVFFFPETDLP